MPILLQPSCASGSWNLIELLYGTKACSDVYVVYRGNREWGGVRMVTQSDTRNVTGRSGQTVEPGTTSLQTDLSPHPLAEPTAMVGVTYGIAFGGFIWLVVGSAVALLA